MIQITASGIIFTFFTLLSTKGIAAMNIIPFKKEPIDTLIVQNDTLFVTGEEYSKGNRGISKCSGKIDTINIFFIGRTISKSEYVYCIGSNPERTKHYENFESPQLTVLLLKNDTVISNLNFNDRFSASYDIRLNNPIEIKLFGTDEFIELNMFQPSCGGYNSSSLFFRRKNKLIKGISIEQYGESMYSVQEVIQPKNGNSNELWIENKVGKDDIVYFTEIEKYEIQNDSLIRLNPKTKNIYYITAKNGLHQRDEASTNGQSLELLGYKTKVNILNRTAIKMTINDDGKEIKGHWVQIEYIGEYPMNFAFIFDGYLSKYEPIN